MHKCLFYHFVNIIYQSNALEISIQYRTYFQNVKPQKTKPKQDLFTSIFSELRLGENKFS